MLFNGLLGSQIFFPKSRCRNFRQKKFYVIGHCQVENNLTNLEFELFCEFLWPNVAIFTREIEVEKYNRTAVIIK